VALDCHFENSPFIPLGSFYSCDVENVFNITSSKSAVIDVVRGTHIKAGNQTQTNNNVAVFHANKKNIEYFPRGLEIYFKNLVVVRIDQCKLGEMHQNDLRPFTKLRLLKLTNNKIKVIEQGLFEFNKELIAIYLNNNEINQIHPNVFDKLNKLNEISLRRIKCLNLHASSPIGIKNMIVKIKTDCKITQNLTITEQSETATENDDEIINSTQIENEVENITKDDEFSTQIGGGSQSTSQMCLVLITALTIAHAMMI